MGINKFVLKAKQLTLLSVPLLICQFMFANDDAELLALMSLLDDQTELATKNKMNADFVPGSVTVLHANELINLGVKNIGEALGFVPGFYVSPGNSGENVVIVRGVGSSLNSSHIKVLLNGVSINNGVYGSADSALRMPIEMVDRIEIIRGPGSSVHGEFAFSGVVNIITSSKQNVHVKAGANNYQQIDMSYASENSEDELNWRVNGSFMKTDGTQRESGIDNFFGRNGGYSSYTSTIFDREQGVFLGANVSFQGYQFDAHYMDTQRGNYFGRLGKSELDDESIEEKVFNMALSKHWVISNTLNTTGTLAYQSSDFTSAKTLVLPAGAMLPGPPGNPVNPDDLFDRYGVEQSYSKASWQINWQAQDNHKLLMILETVHTDVKDSFVHIISGEPEVLQVDKTSLEMNDSERVYNSLVLQEQWQIKPNLETTIGLRYDDYSDVGNNLSPRISGVWRVSDVHILKAQYAEAFRPPTLEQRYFMTGNEVSPDSELLKPENLSTTELSYTYRQADRKFISTLFYADYSNLIERVVIPGQLPKFENIGAVTSQGIELEWIEYIDDKWQLSGNISYNDTKDERDVDQELTGAVNWLANLAINWQSTQDLGHHLLVKYVGEQEGAELPNLFIPHVDSFDEFYTFDYSFNYQNAFGNRHLLMRLDIKNLTDQYWQSQSYQTQWPEGLNQGGRSFHLALEYEF